MAPYTPPPRPTAPPSFGLEMEFVLCELLPNFSQPQPSTKTNTTASQQTTNLSTRQPHHPVWPDFTTYPHGCLKTRNKSDFTPGDFVRMSIAHVLQEYHLPSTARIQYVDMEKYQGEGWRQEDCWYVDDDFSIEARDGLPEGYEGFAVELNSPAYYFNSESLAAVRTAVEALSSRFLISTGKSCGLHVHVGQGVQGFEHKTTLQDLISFLYVFEPSINEIHPKFRIKHNLYAQLLATSTPLAIAVRQALPRDAPRQHTNKLAVEYLRTTESVNELIDLCHQPFSYSNWRFQQMQETSEGKPHVEFKRTIEARAHRSTLDADAITAWLQTVIGIVELVRETADTNWLKNFIAKEAASAAPMGILELLTLMGLDDVAAYYRANPGTSWNKFGGKLAVGEVEDSADEDMSLGSQESSIGLKEEETEDEAEMLPSRSRDGEDTLADSVSFDPKDEKYLRESDFDELADWDEAMDLGL